MKFFEGASAYLLVYYNPDSGMEICGLYANNDVATSQKRLRNNALLHTECFDENGDFNYDDYDTCDYAYYDVITLNVEF